MDSPRPSGLRPWFLALAWSLPVAWVSYACFNQVGDLLLWSRPTVGALYQHVFDSPAIFFCWGFAFLQGLVLFVPVVPGVGLAAQPAALWPRLLLAAFLVSLLTALPLMMLFDVRYYLPGFDAQRFEGRPYVWAILLAWLSSWLVWIPVLLSRARRAEADPEATVRRGARRSLVGLALCLPWYLVLRRKESCACSLGSFFALVVGAWSLLFVGGPLLLVFARDRRIRAALRSE